MYNFSWIHRVDCQFLFVSSLGITLILYITVQAFIHANGGWVGMSGPSTLLRKHGVC